MTYKKIHLIVNNFVLGDTVRIFRSIRNSVVDTNSIRNPNFGHYDEDSSVRVRIDFLDAQAEQEAMNEVNRLASAHTIIRADPNHWVERNQESVIIKNACTLSSECACILSDLTYFSAISAQNPIPQTFFPCFVNSLFQEIDIDLRFRPSEAQNVIIRDHYEDMISASIEAVTNGVVFNRTDFFNPTFFKRFVHMLCNNLIDVNQGGEMFWQIFRRRNRRVDETLDETRLRFCSELSSV
jgi:hypothetical protein